MKKSIFLILFSILFATSCDLSVSYVDIINGNNLTLLVGETIQLEYIINKAITSELTWSSSSDCVEVNQEGLVTALKNGETVVTLSAGFYKDTIDITVGDKLVPPSPNPNGSIVLSVSKQEITIGETIELIVDNGTAVNNLYYEIVTGENIVSLSKNMVTGLAEGRAVIQANNGSVYSNYLSINVKEPSEVTDPYKNMTESEFYKNYKPATSYRDSYFRTLHNFMSGSIAEQNQKPSVASYQPMQNTKYVKNSAMNYSPDMSTYYIYDANGNKVNEIYKGGAYITLEEVAAYVLAFNDVPVNYVADKNTSPSESVWGKYLRLNHSNFSGSTTKYPYEPVLPDISGCGGNLSYYEIDIGTTGTDCDPSYPIRDYNDGSSITRGAARIVYSRFENGKAITDINKKFVFYTYNHYNDFQEYLNYQGGWGKMFGNITGGGTLSSKTDYAPTDYEEIVLSNIVSEKSDRINLYFVKKEDFE